MPIAPPPSHLTHEQYFALEQAEDQRYEYLAGEVAGNRLTPPPPATRR